MVKPQSPGDFTTFRKIEPPVKPRPQRAGMLSYIRETVRRVYGFTDPWFRVVVILPTALAAIYYFFIAADIYVSEAKFVVRSPNRTQSNVLGSLFQNMGLGRSQDDSFSVVDFIASRDAVKALAEKNDLRSILGRPEGDFLTRFPSILYSDTFEGLYEAYGRFVAVAHDSVTGISTLTVKAFRADDARALAEALLQYSEALVNRLNDRARQDAVETARREVEVAEKRVTQVQLNLTEFRTRENMVDPTRASTAVLDLIARLSAELASAKAQLSEVLKASPGSPQLPAIRNRIAALEAQISEEGRKIVGADGAIVPKMAEYERLLLEREFADKMLTSAISSLETARLEAQRQQLYLERVVEPNTADYPLYPNRVLNVMMMLGITSVAYGIGWLLVAGVREHAA